MQRLAFDDKLRNDPRYAMIGIDDLLVIRLRDAIAGRASNEELVALVGFQIDRFRSTGNITAGQGSDEWRVIARALCSAELEALARVAERDFTGTPTAPIIKDAHMSEKGPVPVSLTGLWTDYINSRVQAGFMRDKGNRLRSVIKSLHKYVNTPPAESRWLQVTA